ncbi:MAG: polysaccharide deacetylase family protein [Lentisphaerota bacterium]
MNKIPIFYYHSIGGMPPESLAIDLFKQHLETLREKSFKTITFSDLLLNNYNQEEKNAVLTFDDGLLDNYENAVPLLVEFGFKATFFVVPGYDHVTRWVNPDNRKWSDQLKPGFTIPFKCMNTMHRRELIKIKMEIGCHSYTHSPLTKIEQEQYEHEIIDSKHLLEQELGYKINAFCYPKGRFNKSVIEMVKHVGYLGATTTIPGYFNPETNLYLCRRFLIENPYFFAAVLDGRGLSPLAYLKSKYQHSFSFLC